MIGRLSGIFAGQSDGQVLIDVNGVGYLVEGSAKFLHAMPMEGEAVQIAIETYIREDQLRLFGFINDYEKQWFRLLTSVQGVGVKAALAVLSVLSADEVTQAIAAQDKAAITQAQGIGPKVAQRILQELKDKLPKGSFMPQAGDRAGAPAPRADMEDAMSDALLALENLGYQRMQAHQAVSVAIQELGQDAELAAIIKAALKQLAR